MKQVKEKTTILFVNKHPQTLKPIQVSNRLLLNWKKYVAGIFLLFFFLVSTVVYLANKNIQQYKFQEILTQKVNSMHTKFAQIDTSAVHKKFTNIDKELSVINGFLKARGIQTAFKGSQGGEADNDVLSTDEISDFYEGYLKRIIYNVSYTPIGYPFPGSVTSTFGHRENPFEGSGIETHKGLDIKGPMGAQVKAMAKGVVKFAGPKGGFGNCVIVKHGNGFETLYGHLSKIKVSVDQKIDIGQQIGNIGSTGRSTGPHLHYEVRRNGRQINPQSFLTLN
jgi:murein DD-endopeptidase MepM/ murein hydrolase activator NlpD